MTSPDSIPPVSSLSGVAVPVDFRVEIRSRLKKLGLRTYWLAEQLNGKVTRSAIYAYLRKQSPSEIGADSLEKMLNVIEQAEQQHARKSEGD